MHTHTYYGVLLSLKKEGNSVIFDNMGELNGYYTWQNNTGTES
jgi:hypothetical protein